MQKSFVLVLGLGSELVKMVEEILPQAEVLSEITQWDPDGFWCKLSQGGGVKLPAPSLELVILNPAAFANEEERLKELIQFLARYSTFCLLAISGDPDWMQRALTSGATCGLRDIGDLPKCLWGADLAESAFRLRDWAGTDEVQITIRKLKILLASLRGKPSTK